MASRISAFFTKLLKIILILGVLLLSAPVLIRWIARMPLTTSGSVLATQTCSQTERLQAVVSNVERICSLCTAHYNGVAFVRSRIPIRFLGIKVSEVQLWKQVPGTVRATMDLLGYDLQAHIQISDDSVTVILPEPSSLDCDLHFDQAVGGRSYGLLPLERTEVIASMEESLLVQARNQLITEALHMGLLQEAQLNATRAVTIAVQNVLDSAIEVNVSFLSDCPPRSRVPAVI